MIWYYLVLAINATVSAIFGFLHIPLITELPFGIDAFLVSAVTYFKTFLAIMPPFGILFTAFMIYLGFETTMLILRTVRIIR